MPNPRYTVSPRELESSLRVAFLYFSGMKQAEIAKQLRVTPSTVSRALARARQFVELKYSVPGDEQLEARLLLKYRLRDAVVVEIGLAEQGIAIVGQAAARYFQLNVNSGDRIALSCGETLLEMVKRIPTQTSMSLTVSQLSIEGDPNSVHQAPATLVGLLRSKLSAKSIAAGIQLPPLGTVQDDDRFRQCLRESELLAELRKRALASNFVFIGVAPTEDGRVYAKSFMSIIDSKIISAMNTATYRLRIVGEINNRLFDDKGRDRTDEIPELREQFINILNLNDLQQMRKRNARIVLIATGIKKANAIKVALKTGLANVVITDREVAKYLLED